MKVRLTLVARGDLRSIRAHYLRFSASTADSVRRAINQAIALVAIRPDIGVQDRQFKGVRSKLVLEYPYRIHYRIRGDLLEVLHIRHTARRRWEGEAGDE